jgi:hypothetical protein
LVQFLSLTTDMARLKSSLGRVTVRRPRQPFDHLAVDALELLRRENVSYVLANVTGVSGIADAPARRSVPSDAVST